MTSPSGIAGAIDYKPASIAPAPTCIACVGPIDGNTKGAPSARAMLGVGIIHACSKACAADPRFAAPIPAGAELAFLNAKVKRLKRWLVLAGDMLNEAAGDGIDWGDKGDPAELILEIDQYFGVDDWAEARLALRLRFPGAEDGTP